MMNLFGMRRFFQRDVFRPATSFPFSRSYRCMLMKETIPDHMIICLCMDRVKCY